MTTFDLQIEDVPFTDLTSEKNKKSFLKEVSGHAVRSLAVHFGMKQPAIVIIFAPSTRKARVNAFTSIEDFAAYSVTAELPEPSRTTLCNDLKEHDGAIGAMLLTPDGGVTTAVVLGRHF